MSWGKRIAFDHLLIGLWHFGELLLVHCTVSVHSPCLSTNFEGVGFLSKLVDREAINTSNWSLMKEFYFQFEGPYSWILIYLPILSFLLLHCPTLSCWCCTCWSGDFTLMSIFDYKYWVYYLCICTIMCILSVSRNIINPFVKGLNSHALEWLVFMYLASILKELYIIFV